MIFKLILLLVYLFVNKFDWFIFCNIFFLFMLIIVLKLFGIRLEILGYFFLISFEYNVVVLNVNII